MPFVDLAESALAPGVSPVRIHYRRYGGGFPLLFLHGGWGYEVYPFDGQVAALESDFTILIPDRTGYGQSPRLEIFPAPLHKAGADETIALLDALGIDRCVLWGHSDGAVIAANVALLAPDRVAALVMEATHYDRHKPGSRDFFVTLAKDPTGLGPRVAAKLMADHGADYWQQVLAMEGEAWLDILARADRPDGDMYGNRLAELAVPTLLLHGADDPRTEPGELATIQRLLPQAVLGLIAGAGHSPHSERGAATECTRLARQFLTDQGLLKAPLKSQE